MDIKIMQKPDWVSWDDIHELLLEAHKKNIKNGIVLKNAQIPGQEIKKRLGEDGMCWVAYNGDKLVGTHSVSFFMGKNWWNKGKKVAHGCFTGILKEYQGIGILDEFYKKSRDYSIEKGAYISEGDTAENNRIMRKILEKGGSKTVSFFAAKSKHYSVRMVKWYSECPFSDKYIERRFKIARFLTKLEYKPGRIERNYFLTRICGRIKWMLRIS